MNTIDLVEKLNELDIKFDSLKETMMIFQNNINNNITWFYAVVGIIIALIGAVAVALYFLVKNSVRAGVEKGINDVSSIVQKEIDSMKIKLKEFEESQENTIIKVIKENPQIKWSTGVNSARYGIDSDGLLKLRNFIGDINWSSPINYFEVRNPMNKKIINYQIVDRFDDGMNIKLFFDNESDPYLALEWKFIWVTKD